ncbi:hypothetical protein [Ensifer sp. BR816]|uniref:hypothetical protein n=1 Tax=Rhizobium sp. (strain BR816) TaxID=1057002 RepID=UPI00035D7428|nr:hypothetical protein [Ensifer sp. BR816]
MLSPAEYIPGKDARKLGKIFEQLLDEYRITRDSDEADRFADRLITVYQSGVRDAKLLKRLTIPVGMQHWAVWRDGSPPRTPQERSPSGSPQKGSNL